MLLTRMGKFMYMQAWLTNSIMICMLALHVTTLNHCHIVAMGMTLFQLPKSLILEVLSIKHWRQSAFAETPLTVRHSRDARQRRASMLVIIMKFNVYTIALIIYIYRMSLYVPASMRGNPCIRECGSTLYVGMAQGVSFSVYIGIYKLYNYVVRFSTHLYTHSHCHQYFLFC